MNEEIYILDLIGTFAFAIYGSYFALNKDFDIFGVLVSAFLTAVWWGTIREIILNNTPFYFYDMNYIIAILSWVIFTIFIYNKFHKIKSFAILLDSLGLVTFAFIWANKAVEANLWLFWITFFATITAVWWWILRDIILNKTPIVFKYDLYATVAISLWLIYGLFIDKMQNIIWANLLILIFLLIRLLVIFNKLHLWKPKKTQ